jgi:hypothetical protein
MVPQPNGYEFRRCFTEDRGEGVEKSGGFHQEFVREVSFRKGLQVGHITPDKRSGGY